MFSWIKSRKKPDQGQKIDVLDAHMAGKMLVAMPHMNDPRFARSVILICAHDQNGAMGLVINRLHENLRLPDMLNELSVITEAGATHTKSQMPVMVGGPVEPARGFLLHGTDNRYDETVIINDYIAVTGTQDALKDLAKGKGSDKNLFCLGYSGWDAGQFRGRGLEKSTQERGPTLR